MAWIVFDPDENQRSPYDLTEDQMDLLVEDLDKRLAMIRPAGKEVTTRRIVIEVLDLLEVWHG